MKHTCALFTPHTRGEIVRAIAAGKEWHGTRRGAVCQLKLSDRPNPFGQRVYWSVTFHSQLFSGPAKTCGEALDLIELHVERIKSCPSQNC